VGADPGRSISELKHLNYAGRHGWIAGSLRLVQSGNGRYQLTMAQHHRSEVQRRLRSPLSVARRDRALVCETGAAWIALLTKQVPEVERSLGGRAPVTGRDRHLISSLSSQRIADLPQDETKVDRSHRRPDLVPGVHHAAIVHRGI